MKHISIWCQGACESMNMFVSIHTACAPKCLMLEYECDHPAQRPPSFLSTLLPHLCHTSQTFFFLNQGSIFVWEGVKPI